MLAHVVMTCDVKLADIVPLPEHDSWGRRFGLIRVQRSRSEGGLTE